MTMNLYDAVNEDGLFNVQGPLLSAIDAAFLASGTTIQAKIDTALETASNLGGSGVEYEELIARLIPYTSGYRSGSNSFGANLATTARGLLPVFYEQDKGASPLTTTAALEELIDQMTTGGYYVDANTVTGTAAESASNLGDVKVGVSVLDGKGYTIQGILAETITVEAASDGTSNLTTTGTRPAYGTLTDNWPGGSALAGSLRVSSPGQGLLGQTEWTDNDVPNTPDGWILQTGVAGTDVFVTNVAIQHVIISGTPTGGSYTLQWRDSNDIPRSTVPIAYNATSGTVQTALRAIPGLEQVTVATTGSTPNYTHAVTMTGTPGGSDLLFTTDNLTGGSARIDVVTDRYGDDNTFSGRALRLDSDGSTKIDMYRPITVTHDTVYAVHCAIAIADDPPESSTSSSSSGSESSSSSSSDSSSQSTSSSSSSSQSTSSSESSSSSSSSSSTSSSSSSQSSASSQSSSSQSSSSSSASGSMSYSSESSSSSSQSTNELRFQLVDRIEGQSVLDVAGNDSEYRVDLDALAVGQNRITFFVRAKYYPRRLYFRIHLNDPPDAAKSVYIDNLCMVQATELYDGGPYAAAFAGRQAVKEDDTWTLTLANDNGGKWSTWYERLYGMSAAGLRLPTSGTINIPDTLIP